MSTNTTELPYRFHSAAYENGTQLDLFPLLADNTSFYGNISNTTASEPYSVKNIVTGCVLSVFSLVTIVGNILVITAVSRELYLRTMTNYLIVSLAVADLMVGGIVMPFSISLEITNQYWFYGSEWCDLWHSFDVLASTASILNLCVISLDRYWAITDPIAYTSKMSQGKVSLLIAFVWLCSSGISFPAIAWWKAVTPTDEPGTCRFTEDGAYLIFSSIISFYCPTFIMMFVYWRIYIAASKQIKSLKVGSKLTTANCSHGNKEALTLRMHRGGMLREVSDEHSNESENEMLTSNSRDHESGEMNGRHRPVTFITKRLRQFAIKKRLTKLAREQKAAKTLGIVVGVFIMCWLPFFVFNILFGICHLNCIIHPEIIFKTATWLGYINSGMNPIIYALSMKDFRRAFSKILFACCPQNRFSYSYRGVKRKKAYSTSSVTVMDKI